MGRSHSLETRRKLSIKFGGNGIIIINCENCGKPLNRKRQQHRYCSVKCQQEKQYTLFIEGWLSGTLKGTITGGYPSGYIMRWLREKYDNKCQRCGWHELNPTTNIVPLQVHHIDGNAFNNQPENLELLCPNDHSITSTFGNLNKGNGRKQKAA